MDRAERRPLANQKVDTGLPTDSLPGLGVSLASWEKNVSAHVEQRDRQVLKSRFFIVFDEERAQEVQDAFDERVANILEMHERANANDPTLGKSLHKRLAGAPLLYITFSTDINPPAAPYNREKENNFLAHVANACEEQDWQGIIPVDLSQTHEPIKQVNPDNNVKSLSVLYEKLKKKNNKQPVVIIDGYGAHATQDLGFQIEDRWMDGSKLFVVRSTKKQVEYDSGYGSLWATKFPIFDPNRPEDTDRELPPYDPARVTAFAKGLSDAIGKTHAGEAVCVQAPNNFGKTTALQTLAEMPEIAQNPDVRICYIAPNGDLRDMANHQTVNFETLTATETIIVDEAGRENTIGSTAKETLTQFASAGKHIVRIYPGNDTPPSHLEVISVGEQKRSFDLNAYPSFFSEFIRNAQRYGGARKGRQELETGEVIILEREDGFATFFDTRSGVVIRNYDSSYLLPDHDDSEQMTMVERAEEELIRISDALTARGINIEQAYPRGVTRPQIFQDHEARMAGRDCATLILGPADGPVVQEILRLRTDFSDTEIASNLQNFLKLSPSERL